MARDPIRLPSATEVSGPASMRPSGQIAVADPSSIFEGLDAISSGARGLARGVAIRDERERKEKAISETSAAEASWLTDSLAIGNQFAEDGDYGTYTDRVEKLTQDAKARAAEKITDPMIRQRWMDDVELRRLTLADNIGDAGRAGEREDRIVSLGESLDTTSRLISDPTMTDQVRAKARKDIEGSIGLAQEIGLLSPADAKKFRDNYLEGAEVSLAKSRAELDIRFRPEYVRGNVGISSGMTGTDVSASVQTLNGGKPVALDYAVAGEVAARLGDKSLPSDPKLREAYLTDPDVNARYVEGAVEYLSDRYKGDVSAAVVATVPGGSIELADKWVKSGHDASTLPPAVRTAYETVINSMTPEAEIVHLPVIAAPGVNLEAIDVNVLGRYEQVQSTFGEQLPVISGARDAEHNAEVGGANDSMHLRAQALDIDVSSLSKEERIRFIETASANGFTGIGVYKNSIHIDMGDRRAWGPSHKSASVPGWASDAIAKHMSGEVVVQPAPTKGVAAEYQKLSFDDRLNLYDRSKVAMDQQTMDMKSGLELDVANAPAAIANTGGYDRAIPSAEDFVAAYGAAEGIDRYKKFDASVEVAEKAYGLRTMNNDDIAALVEASMPTATGDMAQIEAAKFDTLSAAAKQVLEEREKDPAAYAMKVFPGVQAAWENAGDDPVKFSQAISMMTLAQEQLGIENPQLLPTEIAKNAADTFNNVELSTGERVGAVTYLPLATNNPAQQEAIYDQLVAQGVPPMTRGAMAALSRGDVAAAQYLFKAALIDPDKTGLKLPDNIKGADITTRINEKLYDTNQIGDVLYGLSDGTAENFQRLSTDGALIERAVKLRLMDGSARNLDEAVDMVSRDMFGDVEVVTGRSAGGSANVKIVLPKGTDPQPLVDGFTALRPVVGDAIMADLTPSMVGALAGMGGEAGTEAAVMQQARDQRVSQILEEGYFTSSGDGFVFVDANTGQSVPNPSGGGPLIFSREDVMQSSVAAQAKKRDMSGGRIWMLPGSGPQ